MWTSGEQVELPRHFNHFSKSNWGDSTEIRAGRTVSVPTTTTLMRIVMKLQDKQWEKVINAGIQASKTTKISSGGSGFPSSDGPSMAPEDDFEIIDDDEDLAGDS